MCNIINLFTNVDGVVDGDEDGVVGDDDENGVVDDDVDGVVGDEDGDVDGDESILKVEGSGRQTITVTS